MAEYLPASTITTLTDDVTVTAGKKIDGVDISDHIHNSTDGSAKISLSNLSDSVIVTPVVDQVLKFNGTEWVNAAGLVVSAGVGVLFYFDNTASDVTGFETLSRIPDVDTVIDEHVTVNANAVLIDQYASDVGGLGITQINAGSWSFNSYAYLDSAAGETHFRYDVYSILNATPWTETLLFTVDGHEIITEGTTSADAILYTISIVKSAFVLNATDRLRIDIYAVTDNVGDIEAHLVHSGPSYASSITTPLPIKHNDLAGLEGGNGEFYHLSLANYTGTGTGIFARKTNTVLTGDTVVDNLGVGIASPTSKVHIHNGDLKFEQVETPASACLTALGAAGNLTGNYYYRVSYVTLTGETNSSAPSVVLSTTAQQVELTEIPVSLDEDVTARNIYRSVSGGDAYDLSLLTTIEDNTTTVYTDDIPDGELQAQIDQQINTTGGSLYIDGHRIGSVGVSSTIWGYDALSNNSGYYNVAIGPNALKANTIGGNNIAIGQNSLLNNTTGGSNTAVGRSTLSRNISGNANVALGIGILQYNISGINNTGIGTYALTYNTGNYNTGIGSWALEVNAAGVNNTALGIASLSGIIDGDYNTGVGSYVGASVTSGNYNTFIGTDTGNNASQKVDAVNSTAIGYGAYTTADNQVVIGNASVTSVTINGSIQSPTIVTPTVASLANMNHTHAAVGASGGVVDHVNLSNKGTNTHAQIDTAIGTTLPGLVTTHAALTNDTHGSGRIIVSQFATIQTARNLVDDAVAQAIFPTTHDVFTAAATTTYKMRGILYITGATGSNHTTAFGIALGGGASLTEIAYTSRATNAAAVNTIISAASDRVWVNTNDATVISGNAKGPTIIQIDGIIRVNAAGTLTPQIKFSTAPGGTPGMGVGSFIELIPIGTNTVTAIGNWS